ncbi:hypothetical protein M9H77_31919 [Catharanthus roseus]|uniref:Uncharacterized protein n=1 Tax=Catharanthus roseus TaxID=4058 RepID=A0ACC0A1G4_CATRO|nr:hypothetical protein M9H77_31919 [Catharanthus roseus]
MVRGSKKKRAHLETSTPASASIPPRTSAPASASISLWMSASPAATSPPPATLTPFPQLPYSSPAPISSPSSSSSATGTSSRPTPSLSARPLMPPVQGALGSRILILPTADRKWGRHFHNQSFLMFEAVGGSNKGYVYGFGSQSAAITVERRKDSSNSSSVSLGYMEQAQDMFASFMTSFASQSSVQLDSIPTMFPPFPPTDDLSHHPVLPPSLAHLHLCSTLILICFVLWYLCVSYTIWFCISHI